MRSEYASPQTYERMYTIMQYDNVLAMRVCLETGLRIEDALRLRWDDFTSAQKFRFSAKKTGKTGTKRISADLSRRLFDQNRRKGDWVFPGRKRGKHRTRQAVWKDVTKAAEILGVPAHVSPHSARKTYAVELRKRDGIGAVQRELQHDRQSTTILYAFADLLKGTVPERPAANLEALAERIAQRVVELLEQRKTPDP